MFTGSITTIVMDSLWPKTSTSGLDYPSSFVVLRATIVLVVLVFTRPLMGNGESVILSRPWSYQPGLIGLGILEVCTKECPV